MMRFWLFLGLFFLAGLEIPLAAESESFWIPTQGRPGQVLQILSWGQNEKDWTARLLTSSQKEVIQVPTFSFSAGLTQSVRVALVPLDAGLAPGSYFLEIRGIFQEVLSRTGFLLKEEVFTSEDIYLSRALTTLRSVPDPQKDAESQEVWALYGKFHPFAVYHQGVVQLPLMASYRESSFFGDRRRFVYSDGTSAQSLHYGMDFAAPTGTPVFAPALGRVVLAKSRIVTGNTVILEHLPGVYSIYMHLDKVIVEKDQWVASGEILGVLGATGLATGPHLHWEWKVNRVSVDPKFFLYQGLLDKTWISSIIGASLQKGR